MMLPKPLAFLSLCLMPLLLFACGGGGDDRPATRPEDTGSGTAVVVNAGPLKSYYFEASVKTVAQLNSNSYLVIKGWFEAPDRTRWDLSSSNPADAQYVRQLLIVGRDRWFYEPGTNTYTYGLEDLPAQLKDIPYPLPSIYQLGLLPSATTAGARKVGTETYLGRAVDVYEASTALIHTTTYVDREYGFTLRQVAKSSDPTVTSFEAKVEKVQFNPRLDAQAFVFIPPSGSRNASATPSSSGPKATHGPLNVPPGLLSPTYIPAGYTLQTSSQTASGGVTSYIERNLSNAAGETLVITETYRPGGLPEHLKLGTVVKLKGGVDGYVTRGGGRTTLVIYDKDIIVVMQSAKLDANELRRVAESMVVAP